MTPAEIKAARASFGLSQAAFADLIGVNPRTVRRWESGETAVPRRAARLVLVLFAINPTVRAGFIQSLRNLKI